MGLLFLAQTALYFVIFLFGFLVAIPLAVTQNDFSGRCVLYGDIKWQGRTYLAKFGSESMCDYNIYLHVIFAILYGAVMAALHVFLLIRKSRSKRLELSILIKLAIIIANGAIAFLTLVSAGTLSAGLSSWCSALMVGKDHGVSIETCSDAEFFNWDQSQEAIYGGRFHSCVSMSIGCAWILLLLWLGQVGLGLLMLFKERGSTSSSGTTSSGSSGVTKY